MRPGKSHNSPSAMAGVEGSCWPPRRPRPTLAWEVTHVSCSRMSTRRCMCSHRCQELASMDSTGFQ